MNVLEDVRLRCPYCGEFTDFEVDCSAGDQSYYEDCEVCCRPIGVTVYLDDRGGLRSVELRRDDE